MMLARLLASMLYGVRAGDVASLCGGCAHARCHWRGGLGARVACHACAAVHVLRPDPVRERVTCGEVSDDEAIRARGPCRRGPFIQRGPGMAAGEPRSIASACGARRHAGGRRGRRRGRVSRNGRIGGCGGRRGPGDAIAALDGTPVTSIAQVQSLIGRHRGGDSLVIDIARSGEKKRLVAVLQSFAHESLPNTTFDYGHVTLPDGIRLRTIVSRPMKADRPAPAVLFLQGGGCSSIDVPWPTAARTPSRLIHAIASRGFVTMRVDKPGAGDSEGPPCAETGFREELAGYQTALRALLADPAVDKNRVFLIGLSLGGFLRRCWHATCPWPASARMGRSHLRRRHIRAAASDSFVRSRSSTSSRLGGRRRTRADAARNVRRGEHGERSREDRRDRERTCILVGQNTESSRDSIIAGRGKRLPKQAGIIAAAGRRRHL